MKLYRIVFLRNEIISCSETEDTATPDNKLVEHNGQMIYALVKAANEEEARDIARSMAKEVGQAHNRPEHRDK